MTPRRRSEDQDDTGVLRRGPAAAWKLLAFLAAFAVTVVGYLAFDTRQARAAAHEVVEARVAPLERKVDQHLDAMASKRELMDGTVRRIEAAMERQDRMLRALCRASARPQACLGED